MKNYIKDKKGRITMCSSNIAKMNIFEYLYHNMGWRMFFPVNTPSKDDLLGALQVIVFILQIIPFGIFCSLFVAKHKIKEAKKLVNNSVFKK